jgi:hypothetical protein
MILDEFRTISQFGRVLWVTPEQADVKVVDAFSAAVLLEKNEKKVIESTAQALLEQACRGQSGANRLADIQRAPARSRSFFNLSPKGRFILGAIHLERWSYLQLAEFLGISPAEVEKAAWELRVQLGVLLGAHLPVGAPAQTSSCPEYDPRQPWTQRFLDEEFQSGAERVYFQNHLMACDTCRRALASCRDLYYAVDAAMPRLDPLEKELQSLVNSLESVSRESKALKADPAVRQRQKELVLFFLQWDVLLVLFVIGWLLFLAIRRG